MSSVTRFYNNGSMCGSFLSSEAAERLNAALSQNIVQTLQYDLHNRNHLVWQHGDFYILLLIVFCFIFFFSFFYFVLTVFIHFNKVV